MLKIIIFTVLVIYIQFFFASKLAIYHTLPNFLLPTVIYVSATRNTSIALILGFLTGLVMDLYSPITFGISALLFTLIAFIVAELYERVNKEYKGIILLFIFLINFLYSFLRYLVFNSFAIISPISIFKLFIYSLYNTLFSLIIIAILFLLDRLSISVRHPTNGRLTN